MTMTREEAVNTFRLVVVVGGGASHCGGWSVWKVAGMKLRSGLGELGQLFLSLHLACVKRS